MPDSWKCTQCGLVNFAADRSCKRCGVPSEAPPVGIVLEDGYVMPPPPSYGGVWRDGKTLVMTKETGLPDRCVKCNAPANGLRLKRRLSWHNPVLYLVIFIAALIYIILAAILSKRATVFLGICAEHFRRRRKLMVVGWSLLAIGLISPVVGFANDYPAAGLLGILVLLISIVWLIVVARVVTVKKIDDRFVWLTGINSNYLSQLPPIEGPV